MVHFVNCCSGCPEEHAQLVEKLQKSYKVANKVSATYDKVHSIFYESAALRLMGANSDR